MDSKMKITIYEAKCRLCGQKIQATSEEQGAKRLSDHIDNDCKTAKTMREWDKQVIYKEMMSFLREEALRKDIKKLLKHYTLEQIKQTVETLE